MIALSASRILQNPVEDPGYDLTGTYRITVLSHCKITENPVQDPA